MIKHRMVNELCWFGATISALATFWFIMAWFDAGTAYPPALARDALLVLSAAAAIVMILLVVLAFSMEQKTENRTS